MPWEGKKNQTKHKQQVLNFCLQNTKFHHNNVFSYAGISHQEKAPIIQGLARTLLELR